MSNCIVTNELPEDAPANCRAIENVTWFVLYDPKNPLFWAGFSGVQWNKEFPYFGPTYVRPEYRGLGIQKILIRVKQGYCYRLGHNKVITTVDDYNTVSINNVESCGFVEVNRDLEDGEIFYECVLGTTLKV